MMMKPLIDSALLPYREAVAHPPAPLPPVFPPIPADPQPADRLGFLQQLVQTLERIQSGPIETLAPEPDLEAFVCWALEQSHSSYFTQDESLLLLGLAWKVQKHLWAAHSSWLLWHS